MVTLLQSNCLFFQKIKEDEQVYQDRESDPQSSWRWRAAQAGGAGGLPRRRDGGHGRSPYPP